MTSTAEGPWRSDDRRRGERVEQLVELDRQHRLGAGSGTRFELRGDDEAEGALRADDDLREVEGLRRDRRTRRGCSRRRAAALSGSGDRFRRVRSPRDLPHGAIARASSVVARDRRRRAPRDRAAGSARSCRRPARRRARARDRSSCRRGPSGRRWSCSRSCRRRWRGWRSRCPARTAGRAARSCAFSSSSTTPGSTQAQRSATFSSRMRLRVLRGVELEARRRSPGPPATCRRRAP